MPHSLPFKLPWLLALAVFVALAGPAASAPVTVQYEITGGTSSFGPISAGGTYTVRYTAVGPGTVPSGIVQGPATLLTLNPTATGVTPNMTKLVGVPGQGYFATAFGLGLGGVGSSTTYMVTSIYVTVLGEQTVTFVVTGTNSWGAGWTSDLPSAIGSLSLTHRFNNPYTSGGFQYWSFTGAEIATVPEPSTLAYLASGAPLVGAYLLARSRRRRRR